MGVTSQSHYTIIKVGAGVANTATDFLLMDTLGNELRSGAITACTLDAELYPLGGLINDGKMNLTPHIGFDDFTDGRVNLGTAHEHIQYWEKILERHGGALPVSGIDLARVAYWAGQLERHSLRLVTETKQKHIGTDRSKALIDSMRGELESSGLELRLGHMVDQIGVRSDGKFYVRISAKTGESYALTCDYLVLAPGRVASGWLRNQLDDLSKDLGIATDGGNTGLYELLPVEVGVRVEMLCEDYPITDDIRDPKIKMEAPNGDQVKTFCTNPRGRIRLDMPGQAIDHKGRKLRMINGDGLRDEAGQTLNTNFAILNKIALKDPEGDTEQHGIDLAIKTFRSGGWRPIVQRLDKFMRYHRSKKVDFDGPLRVKPTLEIGTVVPGDITMTYSARTANNIRLLLERLSEVMPQVMNPENLVYAPEIKLQNVRVHVGNFLETRVNNLFASGNGAGLSSGIVGAASNGFLVAKGIAEKLGKSGV